ncbi:hypothetical protein MTR62_13795 [Novosphingobium sp. 1949]|uniref:Lipoprotein n=1 Tax=Novosphingobium organovorum TaxID=2930092 RepID=A0ABT0BFD1_9SPHN|nr:hypothetical protein [Novosphingobium organovorum]MCJ2183755.1 hypothetical protein [Novosphingobium organovorum]
MSLAVGLWATTLVGCHGAQAPVPGDEGDHQPWHGIEAGEVVEAIGTEPFWQVRVQSGAMHLSQPSSRQEDAPFAVSRFAGRGGLSYSGTRAGEDVTLAVTAGACRDGMSDRVYPFTATLRLGSRLRMGCAWTNRHMARAPAAAR